MNTVDVSGHVLEVAWRRSSYSGAEGGQCVEVAATAEAIWVRDSKNLTGPVLTVGQAAWTGFLESAVSS
ncbi:DUF397 domain-containing protein [Streptomyces sp. RK62]|uniref:DUF397 domain-containing protein n=1 Tax=Streptomyces sp. RK62 TaxID=2824893 RepID=UPI001B39B8E9|nr:DUF397 domain-containing protein [Streptomyces sp. RK62]MBQ0995033.1 DUF397 domain-containing protein [Streptomyces sp. RK62]